LSKFGLFAVAFLLSSCAITSARAEVVYQFSGTTVGAIGGGGGFVAGLSQGFTIIVPDFFTPENAGGVCPHYGCILPTQIIPGTCVGCDPEVLAPGSLPTIAQFVSGYPPQGDYLGFFLNSYRAEYIYNFPLGSFSVPGTY
jgi:hypothetical protein